jgi:hypothetical protein
MKKINSWKTGWLIAGVLFLSGCSTLAPLGMLVGGTPKTYTETDSLVLENLGPDTLDLAAKVGKTLGLAAQGSSRNMLLLTSGTGIGTALVGSMTGKVNSVIMTVFLLENEKKINIQTSVCANFGVDARKNAEKLTSDFKSRLLEKIKQ